MTINIIKYFDYSYIIKEALIESRGINAKAYCGLSSEGKVYWQISSDFSPDDKQWLYWGKKVIFTDSDSDNDTPTEKQINKKMNKELTKKINKEFGKYLAFA